MPVGGVAEWSTAPVLKTDVRESVPRVRIPVPPPHPNTIQPFQNPFSGLQPQKHGLFTNRVSIDFPSIPLVFFQCVV